MLDGNIMSTLVEAGVAADTPNFWSGSTNIGTLSNGCQEFASSGGNGMFGQPTKLDLAWLGTPHGVTMVTPAMTVDAVLCTSMLQVLCVAF